MFIILEKKIKFIYFVLLAVFSTPIHCQKSGLQKLSAEQYKVINDLFGQSSKNKKLLLYNKTDFDRSWGYFFQNTDLIYSEKGIITSVSDSTLKTLLTKKTWTGLKVP